MTQAIREQIVQESRSWIGTPYHHLGDVKGSGVDCAMLLVRVYHAVGLIPAIEPRPYSPQWHQHRSEERYLGWITQHAIPTEDPKPGDACLFRFGRSDRPFSHGAVLVSGDARSGVVVHALRRAGEVIEQLITDQPLAGREVMWFSVVDRSGSV